MSALTKPLNHFTDATNVNQFVPAEQVKSLEKLDVEAINNNPAEYWIIVNLFHTEQPVKLKFALEAKRDGAITAFKTANSVAITSA